MLLHLKNKTPDNGCLESIFMLADNCPVLKESVSDDFLGVLIKDVELVKAEANLDLVADLGLGGRSNARGNGLTCDINIQINFSTHQLGYVNGSVKLHDGLVQLFLLVVNMLGTDTEDNFLADILLERILFAVVAFLSTVALMKFI